MPYSTPLIYQLLYQIPLIFIFFIFMLNGATLMIIILYY
jgi:hypothetical protein